MAITNLDICNYTCVKTCDEQGINARFSLLFSKVCTLETGTSYTLPIASSIILGGIKVGAGLQIDPNTGVLSTISSSSRSNHFSITSADFQSDGVTYLNPSLTVDNTSIYWNDVNSFIYRNLGAWVYVAGGIKITSPGFNANQYSYNLEIFTRNEVSGNSNNIPITSADFEANGTTYLDSNLHLDNTSIFWNDANRFIYRANGEWDYVVGGINILLPGFDASTHSYHLEIFTK